MEAGALRPGSLPSVRAGTGLGCDVAGPAAKPGEAMRPAGEERARLDAAVLDINFSGQVAFPVADLLGRRGMQVLSATGYGGLPGGWAAAGGHGWTTLLRKPLGHGASGEALQRLPAATAGHLLAPAPPASLPASGPLPQVSHQRVRC